MNIYEGYEGFTSRRFSVVFVCEVGSAYGVSSIMSIHAAHHVTSSVEPRVLKRRLSDKSCLSVCTFAFKSDSRSSRTLEQLESTETTRGNKKDSGSNCKILMLHMLSFAMQKKCMYIYETETLY